MSFVYQVFCITIAIMAFISGIYLIYRFVRMPKEDLRFGEGQTLRILRRLEELNDVLNAEYILVFTREGEDRFFRYGTLYYNPEANTLEVVCDEDYSEYSSEGFVKLDLPLMGSQEVK